MPRKKADDREDILDELEDVEEVEEEENGGGARGAVKPQWFSDGADLVPVQSLWAGRLIVNEETTPSGNRYVWENPGAVVMVDPDDVEFLLGKNKPAGDPGEACCGGENTRIYFTVLEM